MYGKSKEHILRYMAALRFRRQRVVYIYLWTSVTKYFDIGLVRQIIKIRKSLEAEQTIQSF